MNAVATSALRTAREASRAAPPLARHWEADPARRARETEWWSRYAELEERFYWVLADSWQPPARLRYLDEMAKRLAGCNHVVDYGCGNGWLARELGTRLQRPITGVDFSAKQIELANDASVDDPWSLFAVIDSPEELPPADAYVFHGVLHHLPASEINQLFRRIREVATGPGHVIIVEPHRFEGHAIGGTEQLLLDAIKEIVREPARQARERGVQPSAVVREAREGERSRWWGQAPYGPSPMEAPFAHDELLALVRHHFGSAEAALVQQLDASQNLCSELAFLREDAPKLAESLAMSLLTQVDALERVLLRLPVTPDAGWFMRRVVTRVR